MRRALPAALLAAALLAACAGPAPQRERPPVELPQAWGQAGDPAELARGWALFGDPVLEALVAEAQRNNAELRVAAARVAEARALLGLADADRYPAVDLAASRGRSVSSQRSEPPLPPGVSRVADSHRASLDVAYELDLWGRYARASEAARAELLAGESAARTVRLSLANQVAAAYFNLIALDAQAQVTRDTARSRREGLGLQRRRFEAGLISALDLRQLEAEAAAAEALLPGLERQRAQQENALAVLLGRSPGALVAAGQARGRPALPAALVPAGLPSQLLLRRPDLAEAEQRLAAADARIDEARARYFPAIALTGSLGSESAALSDLFSGPAGLWRIAASLAQPLYDAGRRDHQLAAAQARREQAQARYVQAVANAFREVQDALAAQRRAAEQAAAERERAAALSEAVRLARMRFEGGIASRLDVLDAERSALQADLNVIAAERDQRAAVADLLRALGGGVEP